MASEFLKRNGQARLDQIERNVFEFHRKNIIRKVEAMNETGRILFGYEELKKFDNQKNRAK